MSIWDRANPQLRDLVAYEPGKPIEDVARELGISVEKIIKLASNENPLGPSPKAIEAIYALAQRAHFYPDGGGYYLRQAIAEKNGVGMENVILGNGSNEIIEFIGHAFLQPGDEIIVADHAFVVYKLMATLFGARTIEIPDPGFIHDIDAMLAAVTPRTKQLYVANPNNPTGTMVPQAKIEELLERVPEHVMVVLDEAYYEFLDEQPDTLRHVRAGGNVVVLRTFSKIQGLANLRIGYGMASKEIIEVLQKTRQPFNANGFAQAAALAAINDQEHQDRTKQITDEGREFLQATFAEMGLEFVPSYANFVLVNVGGGDRVFKELLTKGIIVRAMAGYKLPDWIRVSIGTAEQNRAFVAALKEVLAVEPAAA